MFKNLLFYLKGYLHIAIEGAQKERFINICTYQNIRLWNILPSECGYKMFILVSDFSKLKPILLKTNTKVLIINRIGLPFFFKKYRYRKLYFSGFLFCLIIIFKL